MGVGLPMSSRKGPIDLNKRDELLTRLRGEVEQTRAALESAKQAFEEQQKLAQDLGPSHSDGSILHALMVYQHTHQRFSLAILRYSRFLIDGELDGEIGPAQI